MILYLNQFYSILFVFVLIYTALLVLYGLIYIEFGIVVLFLYALIYIVLVVRQFVIYGLICIASYTLIYHLHLYML